MTLPFVIKQASSAERGMVVELDRNPEFAIPKYVGAGVLSKETRINKLAQYYADCFIKQDPKHARFRFLVATIQKHALEFKILTVLCNHKLKDIHRGGFIKFFTEQQDTINMLMPYLLDNSEKKAKDDEGSEEDNTPNPSVGDPELDNIHLKGADLVRLSTSDLRQIKTLIKKQYEEDASGNTK